MSANWSTYRELLLPSGALTGRGRTVETALRDAIRTGRLAPGTRLPSSRDLAAQLGVARGTITAAYTQLTSEGYLVARRGSGTHVPQSVARQGRPAHTEDRPAEHWRYDLRPGLPALSAFPRAAWLASTRSVLSALPDSALGYPDPAGLAELRAELTAYLGRVRAVDCRPSDVVITNGVAEGISLLSRVLYAHGHRTIAVDSPSHPGQYAIFTANSLAPQPIPLDEHGMNVTALRASGCRAALVTAAHQFPLGIATHPQRRRALLAWAATTGSVIIEDDYDAEHRYDRPPLSAIQALDPQHVVYLGSVSKTLAPALRIGWLVAPPELSREIAEHKWLHDLGCDTLPQAAFAHLLRTGGYDRHLRRTRTLYRHRRAALLEAVKQHLPDWRPIGIAAGLHVVLRLPGDVDDVTLQAKLARRGINAPALSGYARPPLPTPYPGLVIGYANHAPDLLRAAIIEIADAANT